jgi:DNA-binding beta-propeller fold protein YncE
MRCRFTILSFSICLSVAACQRGAPEASPSVSSLDVANRLPTGRMLDPVGNATEVGSMPLAATLSPDGRQILVLLNGYREQGVQVVDRASGRILQTLVQPAAFLGLSFSPDGKTLYASGGNQDVIYRYSWTEGRATLTDSLVLAAKAPRSNGTRYPGGLAPSADGRFLYVAENLADSLAVLDLNTGRIVQRFATERWPYGVVLAKNGTVYVSAWGGSTVSTFLPASGGLSAGPRIKVGRHPSALAINADGSRLFVASASSDRIAVVDTKQRRVINEIIDTPPSGPGEGSTPNALALSSDGTRLFVAEADNNAIAVIDLTPASAGMTAANGDDRVTGRVPTQWYPTGVIVRGDSLIALTGKGRGTTANPRGPVPLSRTRGDAGFNDRQYTLGQTTGSLVTSLTARARGADLDALSARVAKANQWGETRVDAKYPPFEHVIYIIKENRTYDQFFGDLPQADGDTSLVYFGRPISPNHHALAERFGIFDRFFVNAEVSPDGHNWSTAAYTTDYLQKTVPSNYSKPSRGRTYDWEGMNRGRMPVDDDDVAEPVNGYLWNLAQKAGITFQNYGEFVIPANADPDDPLPAGYRGNKPFLRAHTNPLFPGYDLNIRDQRRADVWLADLSKFTAKGEMPALQIMRLPNDHTSAAKAGSPTPRAHVADNDLALGRIIEGLSTSPFWKNTIVFVLEDDAQNGSDHVDSHRSPLLVISAWNKAGVHHRFANTTDVIATIERILKLGTMSQFDHFGRPLTDIFASASDLSPYRVLTPSIPLDQKNPRATREARESARLDLRIEDAADEEAFNRILWRVMKGGATPYPGARRMSTLEYARAR